MPGLARPYFISFMDRLTSCSSLYHELSKKNIAINKKPHRLWKCSWLWRNSQPLTQPDDAVCLTIFYILFWTNKLFAIPFMIYCCIHLPYCMTPVFCCISLLLDWRSSPPTYHSCYVNRFTLIFILTFYCCVCQINHILLAQKTHHRIHLISFICYLIAIFISTLINPV